MSSRNPVFSELHKVGNVGRSDVSLLQIHNNQLEDKVAFFIRHMNDYNGYKKGQKGKEVVARIANFVLLVNSNVSKLSCHIIHLSFLIAEVLNIA